MLRNHLLRLGHPVSVVALLEALVVATNERNDDDPRAIRLKYLAADGRRLPAWVNSGCGETGLIVSDEPCPEFAQGTLLFWLRFLPLPGRGRFEDGLYHGLVVARLWQAPEYPLSAREVNWLVADRCGAHYNGWWHLTRGWQTLSDDTRSVGADLAACSRPYIVLGRTRASRPAALGRTPAARGRTPAAHGRTPAAESPPGHERAQDGAPAGAASPQPTGDLPTGSSDAAGMPAAPAAPTARRRKARLGLGTGKARTPWNQALMETMRQVPTEELYNFDPFFKDWLKSYMLAAGDPPQYPEDTFKQAAAACAERIIRERAARDA